MSRARPRPVTRQPEVQQREEVGDRRLRVPVGAQEQMMGRVGIVEQLKQG